MVLRDDPREFETLKTICGIRKLFGLSNFAEKKLPSVGRELEGTDMNQTGFNLCLILVLQPVQKPRRYIALGH